MATPTADIGLIGLAVMGENLVLNMESHGFTAAVFNRTTSKVDEFLADEAKGTQIEVFSDFGFAPKDDNFNGVMPLKLGHIAYTCPDVQSIVKFYCDVLGFRVSDWRGDFFAFLRCSRDHHTVNFLRDAFGHLKVIAYTPAAAPLLVKAGMPEANPDNDAGMISLEASSAEDFVAARALSLVI